MRRQLADGMVALFQTALGIKYDAALQLYERIFRSHMDAMILFSILLIFAVLFYFYLRWLTRYFETVSEGMDLLLADAPGEISLPPELFSIERKMNLVKHTMLLQKSDMLMAEQRKNDLIMYLAHDLKTPLASVIGYLNLLRDEREISEGLREKYLLISLNKAERLEELINEFFEIARFNLSDIILQYSKINLARLLEQLVFEFNPMFREKNLSCKLDIPNDIMLRCDADKIQRVFDNLLRNAVIYSFNDSVIEVTADCQDDSVTVQFLNHGDTIPKEKLEQIFGQFYRLDTSRSTERGGAGLGLAIAKEIIELHKGTIVVKSEEEVIEFIVTLPFK